MKTKSQNWEADFDEKFLIKPQSEFSVVAHQLHLKDFIRANFVSKEELQEELERLQNTSLDHRLDAISVLSDLLRLP